MQQIDSPADGSLNRRLRGRAQDSPLPAPAGVSSMQKIWLVATTACQRSARSATGAALSGKVNKDPNQRG